MVFEVDRVVKSSIPAVRIAVAEILSNEYSLGQDQIAKKLGITQAAVNKYLKKKYSKETKFIIGLIKEKGFDRKIAKMIIENQKLSDINNEIDRSASSSYVISNASKLF
jgi:predicted transcriptional regulator